MFTRLMRQPFQSTPYSSRNLHHTVSYRAASSVTKSSLTPRSDRRMLPEFPQVIEISARLSSGWRCALTRDLFGAVSRAVAYPVRLGRAGAQRCRGRLSASPQQAERPRERHPMSAQDCAGVRTSGRSQKSQRLVSDANVAICFANQSNPCSRGDVWVRPLSRREPGRQALRSDLVCTLVCVARMCGECVPGTPDTGTVSSN